MKRILYLIPVLVLLASMIPLADVAAYEEEDVQVYYEYEPGVWVEIDPNDPVEIMAWMSLKLVLNVGEAVDIWSMMEFTATGNLEAGESVFIGYGISGSGSSQYSGLVLSGMDSPDAFTQAGDPGGQFFNQSGPATINIDSTQYIEWEITDNGGLPSTIFYFLYAGGSHDVGDITTPISFTWGVTGFDPDCDDSYQVQEEVIASQEIDATDEDGEYAEIVTGNLYRLEVWGGPWDDGVDPARYDTAISGDGEEWTPLTDLFADAECFDVGDDPGTGSVFFLAESDDFYIRVNDEDDAFADNDGSMVYSLSLAIELFELTCSDQFEWDGEGDPYASYTVPADLSLGIEITDLEIGAWYVYVTRDGPWLNNGSTERYDMAVKDTVGEWEPIADYEMVECIEDADDFQYTRYYFQAWDESLWTRVNDTDLNWANDNSMGVDIYEAEYERFLATCEGTYIIGDLVISKNFQGNQSGGVNVGTYDHYNNLPRGGGEGPFEVLRYYVIETLDGPWYDSGDPVYTTQVRKEADGDWYETYIHPEMDCVAETDLLGHVRGYFDMDKPYEYYIRVNETTTWTDNSGSMRYNLYEGFNGQVIDPEDPAEDGYCDDYYTRGSQVGSITFSATNSAGVNVPGMTVYNSVYSIVTDGGPWNDGSDDLYDVDISDDGGVTWYPLAEYPGMLCKQLEGTDYVEVFLQHVRGRRWKVRVSDTVFSDNSGNMSIIVYGADSDVDPWHTCSDDYNLVEVAVPDPSWAAWNEGGTFVPYISPSTAYIWAIEITGGPWTEDIDDTESTSYAAEIYDGTWQNHNSYGICTEQVGTDNQYFRTYFNPTTSNYKLRVDVTDDDWDNNYGYLSYKLYRAYAIDPDDPDPDDPDDPGLPGDWDLTCYVACERPASINLFSYPPYKQMAEVYQEILDFLSVDYDIASQGVNVPNPSFGLWLEYFRCSFSKWLSWCPEHTAALQSIPLMVRNREPFASFYVLADAGEDIQDMLDSYDWYPDSAPSALMSVVSGGGEESGTPWSFIPEQTNSPWSGGEITYGEGGTVEGGGEGFDLTCPDDMRYAAAAAFGISSDYDESPLLRAYCFTVRTPFVLKAYWMWITLSVEISFIFFFIKYLVSRLRGLL